MKQFPTVPNNVPFSYFRCSSTIINHMYFLKRPSTYDRRRLTAIKR